MFEKLYSLLLRLFPSAFRGHYEEEALQLLRDRLSNERGFYLRLRLCFDLTTDAIGSLPRAYRNSYTEVATAASLTPQFDGVPSFRGLQKEPIRRDIVIMAFLLTVTALATFSYVWFDLIIWSSRMVPCLPSNPGFSVSINECRRFRSCSTYARVYTIGGNVHPPIPVKVLDPEFPNSAQDIKGPFPKIVIVRLVVDASGSPHDVRVVQSYRPDFDAPAVNSVERDHFAPAEKAGGPVAVELNMVVNFWKDGQHPAGPPPPPPEQR